MVIQQRYDQNNKSTQYSIEKAFEMREKFIILYGKECKTMFLLSVLILTAIFLILCAVLALSIGGTVFVIIFGDVIVCVLAIIWIIKRLSNRRK